MGDLQRPERGPTAPPGWTADPGDGDGTAGAAPQDTAPLLVSAAELRETSTAVLDNLGAPAPVSIAVATSLVDANLSGHDSHGVRRLPVYAAAVRDGRIDPLARPEVGARGGATLTVHGNRAFGQLAAALAVEALVETAHEHGVGVAAISECNHVGRLGEYVETLAGYGLIGMALCNADPTVAPHGGRERRLGTNPMAWALPRPQAHPLVVDWATASVAEGKIALAHTRGERAPAGAVIDPEGAPSTDPADLYRGGALLPFAGHKGYGLSVVIEVVGGLLSGGGISCLPGYDGTNGTVFVAVDPTRFVPQATFQAQVERFSAELRRTPLAHRHSEVLVPGDVERRARDERTQRGIPVPAATWRELCRMRSGPSPPGSTRA